MAFITILLLWGGPTSAPCQDWVHPNNRHLYPGYAKHEDLKKNSSIWTYATNRPGGNIIGGGTIPYNEYKPSYAPPINNPDRYNYKRPRKLGGQTKKPCNCN